MIEPDPSPDIESLVRSVLERDSERFDPRPLFERIQAQLKDKRGAPAPVPARRRSASLAWRWATLSAAAVLLVGMGISLFWQNRAAMAKGETIVREARKAHSMPVDRCYLVEVRRESPLAAELAPNTPAVRMTRLWTRGDRFWVESVRPDQRWAWGRDEANRFWIAFGPHTAVRVGAEEVPYGLKLYCDIHSLNVEQLLGDVLSRFEMTRETKKEDSDSSTIRVHARSRELTLQRPSVETVDLEIDVETRVIRRMVVRRVWNDQPFATVSYTLAETDALDPADYQLEGHLTSPSQIFTRDHEPQRRKELLARWFGTRAGRWFPTTEPSKRQ
jgi:hypothetical protein